MEKERRNKKTKSVGNGEGTLYYSESLERWIYQYYVKGDPIRKTLKQRKKETVKDFKARVSELKVSLDKNTYIAKRIDSTKSIIENHIKQKFNDKITKGNSYKRDKETLQQLEKCCDRFIYKPIQQVTFNDIQVSKENMKKYSQSGIDKMWRLLTKAFSIASSPSVKLISINIMNDENLRKPISDIDTKKIYPLKPDERKKLNYILDNQERNHKYRNIVKMEWITAMRIGEVLSRSQEDINENKTKLHIHNTLTEDEDGNTIIGEHTKTYNKKTGIDEGERYFPIDNEVKVIINEQLSNKLTNLHGLLFWDYENNTFVKDTEVNSWLRRINEKYHISDKSLHNHRLRHDKITQWREAGMDMESIQYFAGHVEGSVITTNVYIDISQEYAFKEYKKIN